MFSTVRYFIKTSIVFLLLGVTSGIYISLSQYVFHTGVGSEFISAHTHIILVGAVMMMIMGVALWFFPRPEKEDKRYNPDLIYLIYWIMTVSTLLRYIAQVVTSFLSNPRIGVLISFASVFQGIGMLLFFYSIWGRIRAVGSQVREALGEKF